MDERASDTMSAASQPSAAATYRHDVFLSYSHAADGQLAAALQAALQQFARPWYRLRAIRVFRDKTGLSVTPKLWEAIRRALESAEYFILMASPQAAQSRWVEQEVDHWRRTRSVERLLIVWTAGDLQWAQEAGDFDWHRTDCLPACLRGAFRTEPLFLDMRFASTANDLSLRRPEFLDAVARLSAAIRNHPLDEIIGEDVLQHRRTRRLAAGAIAALSTLLVAIIVAAGVALDQRNAAQRQQQLAEQRRAQSQTRLVQLTVANGTRRTDEGDLSGAALWFADAHRVAQGDPQLEAEQRLRLKATLDQLPRLVRVWVVEEDTRSVEFSQDDRYVLVRTSGELRVWDIQTGAPQTWKLPSTKHTLLAAYLASDRQRVLTAAAGHEVKLLDAGSAELWSSSQPGALRSAAFSADGTLLVTTSDDDAARVWDVESGRLLQTLTHQARLIDATPTRDGRRVVTITADNTAHVWTLQTGAEVRVKHEQPVLLSDVAADTTVLMTVDDYRTLRLWDAESGVQRSRSPWDWIDYAEFSPDGTRGVLATRGGSARVWNVKQETEIAVVDHGGALTQAVFSPDAKRLATAATDRIVRVWNLPGGTQASPPLYHEGAVGEVAFSHDGNRLATTTSRGIVRVWDLDVEPMTLRHRTSVEDAAFQPRGGPKLLTVSGDEPRLWDLRTQKFQLLAVRSQLYAAAFSPDGRRVVTAEDNGSARVWDVATGASERTFAHDLYVKIAGFHPDGRRLLTVSHGSVRGWKLENGGLDFELTHDSPVTAFQFGAGGRRLMTLEFDGIARVWDLESRRELARGDTRCAALSPDGTRLAITSAMGRQVVVVLDVDGGRRISTTIPNDYRITRITFSPDGQTVLSGDDNGSARLWDAKTGAPRTPPLQHEGTVLSVAFSHDGTRVVTGSADRSARVWRALTGEPLTPPLRHRGAVVHAEFSPDDQRVVTASNDDTARVWDVSMANRDAIPMLTTRAEVLAARRLDATGAVVFLTRDELVAAWQKLSAAEPR